MATAITFIIAHYIEGVFSLEPFIVLNLYDFILLLPIAYFIFKKFDLSNKTLLDEYLFLSTASIIFGLFVADIKDFFAMVISERFFIYILIILLEIFFILIVNHSLKIMKKNK